MSSDKDVKVGRRGALLGAIGSIAASVAVQRGAAAAPPPKPELVPAPKPHPYASGPVGLPPLRDIREYPLGFQPVHIGPGTGVVPVVARLAVVFRGRSLVMPVNVGQAFRLAGIRVDGRLCRTPGAMGTTIDLGDPEHVCHPAAEAISVAIEIDPAKAGADIELLVENVTDKTQTFIAAMIGTGAI